MLDHVGAGGSTDAKALLSNMDGNGDGSLDADELDAGVRDLMPPPASTVAFAERNAPPAEGDDDLFSKVDTDGDGSVSEAELLAELAQQLQSQYDTMSGRTSGTTAGAAIDVTA